MAKEEQKLLCPHCGEPIKPHWRLCPACEGSLKELLCPECRSPVKDNWKRCPECETQLICPKCGERIKDPTQGCAFCDPEDKESEDSGPPDVFRDDVCGIEMVFVNGGVYQMGDTIGVGAENEVPVHEVEVADFYIARYPVTQSQWTVLMPDNPSRRQGDRLPVEQATWEQADGFAAMLCEAHGKSHLFSLPSEVQWEYAARSGGKRELYAGGSDIDTLGWYAENSQGRTQPVGTKAPNGLGIFDMSGNVWEWCRDIYAEDAYSRYGLNDSTIEERTADRVIRGGSWHLDAWSARCTRRLGFAADFMGPALGFRLVMVPA